eukprot:CAMPEP_0113572030 /NCGR_PEP_ID=MMETSP0015_2-20120614/25876_1 /TAXON_ID=2838 /ORGANISM="Odontella" /LENGTH=335 /DNA_ID=CAMNT_0000475033 /DNA_START=102 /DNA_END=1109 /DNA_ORIENTATION=- /assembly_acc=CAM_ASM_000160
MKTSALALLAFVASASAFAPSSSVSISRPAFFTATSTTTTTALNMADVSIAAIKELREETGAGMMDCKKALIENDGDGEAAQDWLREKGLAKADKKASRVAAEGKIFSAKGDDGKAVLVEVNCETDFVAKDDSYLSFANTVATAALSADDVESLMASEVDGGDSLETTRQALVAKIGENIQVRRMASRGDGETTVGSYVHMNKIGVMVELDGGDEDLATDVAMHVAAMNPPYATQEDVPAEDIEKERSILAAQVADSGKPPEIVEKMVEGRLRKYLEEICLVSQTFVKTNDCTVGELLKKNGATMKGFSRVAVGEGIEKKEDDFAAEVAKMAAGN